MGTEKEARHQIKQVATAFDQLNFKIFAMQKRS